MKKYFYAVCFLVAFEACGEIHSYTHDPELDSLKNHIAQQRQYIAQQIQHIDKQKQRIVLMRLAVENRKKAIAFGNKKMFDSCFYYFGVGAGLMMASETIK